MSFTRALKKTARRALATVPTVAKQRAVTHDMIAERARTVWLAKGSPTGQDDANWREAEMQLKKELNIP